MCFCACIIIIIIITCVCRAEVGNENRKGKDERAREETHLQAVRVAMGGADRKAEVLSRLQDKSVERRKKGIEMNEKLKNWAGKNFNELRPNTRTRGVTAAKNLVTYGYANPGENDRFYRLRLSFHTRAVKQLGWMKGDRLSFSINENGSFIVFRDQDGYALTTHGTKAGITINRLSAQFPVKDESFCIAIGRGIGKNVEINEGAIAFDLE